MTHTFDQYQNTYEGAVEKSVSFSGLEHQFFLDAKADVLRDLMVNTLSTPRVGKMLDVGCGVGRVHPVLKPLASQLSGLDPSPACVERARLEHPTVDYRVGDGCAIPYGDDEFDVAVAICAFHHIDPQHWATVAGEMHRVVRPGGLVAIIEHNPLSPGTQIAVARCPFDADAVLLKARTARSLLSSAGLKDVVSHHFLIFPSSRDVFRRVEKRLAKWPIGAQYVAAGEV